MTKLTIKLDDDEVTVELVNPEEIELTQKLMETFRLIHSQRTHGFRVVTDQVGGGV